MKTVTIREAKNRLAELGLEVERGETIVVTRNGSPVFELATHRAHRGLRLEAIDEFKRKHGLTSIAPFIAEDFDDPLPEDFLLRPLPPVHEAIARHPYSARHSRARIGWPAQGPDGREAVRSVGRRRRARIMAPL
jgi:prevent-host-death family protein